MTNPHRLRLLSIEDNAETRLLIDHLLNDSYRIKLVSEVEEALEALQAEEFDLLLVDINLGEEVDGIELLHRARQEKMTDDAPAIALTAYAMPGDRQEFLEKGFDAYVSKPFTAADLREAISRALSSAVG